MLGSRSGGLISNKDVGTLFVCTPSDTVLAAKRALKRRNADVVRFPYVSVMYI